MAISYDYSEYAPIDVDFDKLKQENNDIIAWIYSENTPINYPIVQSSDNNYYLRRLTNGTYNRAGTLFMDCQNSSDFSDFNTVIYGHNMKTDIMFGTLPEYKKQSYYDEHPFMWLLTPEQNYKIVLISGFLTTGGSEFYNLLNSVEEFNEFEAKVISNSDFEADVDLSTFDKTVTLSTCSYETSRSRYIVIGGLIEVG